MQDPVRRIEVSSSKPDDDDDDDLVLGFFYTKVWIFCRGLVWRSHCDAMTKADAVAAAVGCWLLLTSSCYYRLVRYDLVSDCGHCLNILLCFEERERWKKRCKSFYAAPLTVNSFDYLLLLLVVVVSCILAPKVYVKGLF